MAQPFNILTYFPTGDPDGYRISHVPTQTIQTIYIPRKNFESIINQNSSLNAIGLYFLIDTSSIPHSLYIGESEELNKRLTSHFKNKSDWSLAIVITTTAKSHQLNKADIKYLESIMYQRALEADRYTVNQNVPKESFVHESRKADLKVLFQQISTLVTFLGHPLFSDKDEKSKGKENKQIYRLPRNNNFSKARYVDGEMIVLKGSKLSPITEKNRKHRANQIQALIENKTITPEGQFLEDYTFGSPSGASSVLLRTSTNGWAEWKLENGTTLDEIERKSE